MKNVLLTILLIFSLAIFSSICFAQENLWENNFVQALQKGRAAANNQGGGLGYTPAEESVLEKAIKEAMEMKAPPCEAMKIAVDLKYNPYAVIKNIFGYGGQVSLNQLCMCATESGINKQIIAKAAADAASPLGTPIFSRDEITQAQCIGLGYTPIATATPRILPEPIPDPISVSSPAEEPTKPIVPAAIPVEEPVVPAAIPVEQPIEEET